MMLNATPSTAASATPDATSPNSDSKNDWSHLMANKGELEDCISIMGEANSNSSGGPLRTNSTMSQYHRGTASLYSKRAKKLVGRKKEKRFEEVDGSVEVQSHLSPARTRRALLMTSGLCLMGMASFFISNVIINAFHLRPINHIEDYTFLQEQHAHAPTQRFEELLQMVLPATSRGIAAFETDSTPQHRALDWLANRDLLQLNATSSNLLQRYALATLFYSTTTASSTWKRGTRWMSELHECEWHEKGGGVRACNSQQQITDLSLWNNLDGTIPAELGYGLPRLQVLYLAHNKLSGTLPSELGLLTDLTYLGVQNNQLTGSIPSEQLGALTELRTIYLERNDFSGVLRHAAPLCQLKRDAAAGGFGGVLKHITADCRRSLSWRSPKLSCECCTKCYRA